MARKPDLLKELGSKILSSHGAISCLFDRLPPLRTNQNFVIQPVRDQLLAGPHMTSEFSQTVGQSSLGTTGDVDGAFKGDNVSVLHGAAHYTNTLVPVNMRACVTVNKKVCNVVDLQSFRNSAVPKTLPRQRKQPKAERKAKPGSDGLTLGDRLHRAMAHRAGMLGRNYEPVDLLKDANESAGATVDAPVISQQMISEILRNRTSRSSFTPFLAKACGVSVVWLSNGRGKMLE